MKFRKKTVMALAALALSGCAGSPQWNVYEDVHEDFHGNTGSSLLYIQERPLYETGYMSLHRTAGAERMGHPDYGAMLTAGIASQPK